MTVLYLIVDRSNGFFLPGIYEPPRMSKWTFEHWNEAHDRNFRNNAKDSVPIEFNSKKIIFVRRAQRTEFNISSKKQSRHIPYCIRSIHVIRFNVLIVYHPWLSNGFIIDVHLDLGLVKYWAQVNAQLQGKGLGKIFQVSYFSFTMVNEIDFGTCQEVKQVILFKGLNILYMYSIF